MKSILLVEDDEPFCALVKKIISPHFEVQSRNNGLGALAYLRTGPIPDVIVTDINLPGITGLELLQYVKRSGLLCKIPVVILSGRTEGDVVDRCMMHGAAKYVSKPFEPKKFVADLQELVSEKGIALLLND